jgi:hypothetical protein
MHSTSGNRGGGGGCSPDLVRWPAPWREWKGGVVPTVVFFLGKVVWSGG